MKITRKEWEPVIREERESMIALAGFIGGLWAGFLITMFVYFMTRTY